MERYLQAFHNQSLALNIEYSVIAEHQFDDVANAGHIVLYGRKLNQDDKQKLLQHGIVQVLAIEDFFKINKSLLLKNYLPVHGSVVLAHFQNQYNHAFGKIFTCYGYETIVCQNVKEVENALEQKPILALFDVDCCGLSASEDKKKVLHSQTLTVLKRQMNFDAKFAVITVKDFNTGSIFETIGNKTKDVSNILLSHAEALIFLQDYLMRYHLGRIAHNLEKQIEKQQLSRYYLQSKPEMSLLLRNPKKIFQRLQGEPYDYSILEKKKEKIEYFEFILSGLKTIYDFAKSQQEELNRNAFIFT